MTSPFRILLSCFILLIGDLFGIGSAGFWLNKNNLFSRNPNTMTTSEQKRDWTNKQKLIE